MDLNKPAFDRWDILNPVNWITAILLSWAIFVYHKPHAPEFLPSYSRFDDIAQWGAWGWVAVIIAIMIWFAPRVSWVRALGFFAATIFFLATASAYAWGVGYTVSVAVNGFFAVISVVMFARTVARANAQTWWFKHLASRPPRWLRRLARVDEFERESGHG